VCFDPEALLFELGRETCQPAGNNDEVGVESVDRVGVAVDGQPPNEAIRAERFTNCDKPREFSGPAVRSQIVGLHCGHAFTVYESGLETKPDKRWRIGYREIMLRPAFATALALLFVCHLGAQDPKIIWTAQEAPLYAKIRGLRDLPDKPRAAATKQLALDIRALPVTANKLQLATGLTNLSTEGDFGRDTLQEVTTTLAQCLRELPPHPPDPRPGKPVSLIAAPFLSLAQLVKYEHMQTSLNHPQFDLAMAKLAADDAERDEADFTLTDLNGQKWNRRGLMGKVVVVNFWATWCPPCRKEMPDLDALYKKFKSQGLIVLAISDEQDVKVRSFLKQRPVRYPVLIDTDRRVNELYRVEGIPKTYIYGRDGKLVAESIDMRTRGQFLEMLAQAGIR